ncbi:hypothetical protein GCM10008018_36540 [Paenibacillus marchantiophytorum]|uniref:Uncharacterized protein n=1 Tax=Paenibacillus marchantiophytorum TaxID=1619310 RepID=A0ABQ1ETV3_9BACL|nr:hypothetical protein GCM10008018_36540 [Paenibacillus marchantiophytorum]
METNEIFEPGQKIYVMVNNLLEPKLNVLRSFHLNGLPEGLKLRKLKAYT